MGSVSSNIKQKSAIRKLIYIQQKIQHLEKRLLTTQHSALHKLALSCQLLYATITMFNDGIIKVNNSLIDNNPNTIDFIQELANFIPLQTEISLSPSQLFATSNTINSSQAEKLLEFDPNLLINYKNGNLLNIITKDNILILDQDYAVTAKVLVKQLPHCKLIGHFFIVSNLRAKFKTDYFIALDHLLSTGDVLPFNYSPLILSELFMMKSQQLDLSINNLADSLINANNEDNLDLGVDYNKLVAELMELFRVAFSQMQHVLLNLAENIFAST